MQSIFPLSFSDQAVSRGLFNLWTDLSNCRTIILFIICYSISMYPQQLSHLMHLSALSTNTVSRLDKQDNGIIVVLKHVGVLLIDFVL